MKIGPLNIKLREQPSRVELGGTGTLFFAGKLAETDYNPDLRGDKALKVFDQMRKSDGQVKAGLLACELPLRAASWEIEAYSDKAQDKEIADFVRWNLFESMTITWDDLLRHILLMLPFGHSVFEKVWEPHNGKIKWRKLAPRLPKSIIQWHLDDEGGLAGITQHVYKGKGYEQVFIPVSKLLAFTLGREGSDYRGVSLLRSAYKHWYYKDNLYRIDGIAAERHGVGLAVFTLPSTATTEGPDSDLGKITKIGESLHSHERSFVALPERYSFDLKGVAGQLHDIIKSVEHHDLQIVRSILAQFINLGSGEVGSYALSQDQSGFFLMALRAVGLGVCDTFNRYAIPQLVDYNWNGANYPRLRVSGLEVRDIGVYCKAVADLVNAGVLLPDEVMDSELRKLLRLAPEPTRPRMTEARVRLTEGKGFASWRPLRGVETHVAFAEVEKSLDSAEERFVQEAKEVQAQQIERIVELVEEALKRGDFEKVARIEVPYRAKMAQAVERVLVDLFNYGREQVVQELNRQRAALSLQDPLMPEEIEGILAFLTARAHATSSVLAAKLRGALAWESLAQIREGAIDRAALEAALTTLSDAELKKTAAFSVSESFGFGRRTEAQLHKDEIDRVIYSAVLDHNTCSACAEADGKEFGLGSAAYEAYQPPYKNCEGQDRCRCMYIFVHKGERPSTS